MFLKKGNLAKIIDKSCDTEGNLLAILMEYENRKILLEGIYGPNEDCPQFYENEAFKHIENWQPDYSIFLGDFNVTINPNLDNKNYVGNNNPLARRSLKDKMEEFELLDVWRELNPLEQKFTWKKFRENKMARLDYFLVSSSLLPYIQDTDIFTGSFSDHSGIFLDIDFSRFKQGRGFWKFNASLLKNKEYVDKIKDVIKRVTCQYAIVNNDENYIPMLSTEEYNEFMSNQTPESLQALRSGINPQLFLDTLLMEIRRETIMFSSRKKRERVGKEQLLNHDIEALEKRIQQAVTNDEFAELNDTLHTKKQELEEIHCYQAHGAFVRARAKYKCEGEKPTRLFCTLEKHNAVQKYIPKLQVEKEDKVEIITDQKDIEKETHKFYKDLFGNKDNFIDVNTIEDFLGAESASRCPKLTEIQKHKMEGKIELQELTNYVKKSKNNAAPGSTGFTNEFYKFFWRDLKIFVLNFINYGFENGMLSISQRLGIITLIPKGDKDKTFLKNWRPLTLLNSIYKMVSGVIAERMKPVLDSIIHGDQKGFVSGRYIGEAIRTTYDIMQWAKQNNKVGVILAIDFEKAYDSISFSFIEKCLRFFNFGESIIGWISMLLKNFSSVINLCGNISDRFNINRGCRQGDPIASFLFIISIEILALKLRSDIKGFDIENTSHLLELYADDCSIFLPPSEENLRNTLNLLSSFFKLSGLRISVAKTKAIWFGSGCNFTHRLCTDIPLVWDTEFRLLGIDFDARLEKMERNFDSKLDEIRKLLNCWFYRTLTPYGKITVVKTLALSKLSHAALVIPSLKKNKLIDLEKILFKFIWGDKPDKVCRDAAKLPEKAGGLGMVDIGSFWIGLKFSWLRRMLSTTAFWPKLLEFSISKLMDKEIKVSDLVQLGPITLQQLGKKMGNEFWKEVLTSIPAVMEGALFCFPKKLLISSFWGNPAVTRNDKPIKQFNFPNLFPKIKTLADFFDANTNNFSSKNDLEFRHGINLEENEYIELRFIIKSSFEKLGLQINKVPIIELPYQPLIVNIATLTHKGCNSYYKLIRKRKNLTRTQAVRENKWHVELNKTFGVPFWNSLYNFTANIKHDNKIKWMQFQIVRNCQFSNYRVSKFKPNISPLCSYCEDFDEKLSHLYFQCVKVEEFWDRLRDFFSLFAVIIPLNITTILFGYIRESSDSKINLIILSAKRLYVG